MSTEERSARPLRVTCVGEQTTHSAHRENDPEYPTRLAELLGSGYTVLNRGLPKGRVLRAGTAPDSESYAESPEFRASLEDAADIIVIGPWGRHDTYPGNWPEHQRDFASDLRQLVRAYVELPHHPTVYLVTPLPLAGTTDAPMADLVPPTREVAAELGVSVIDLWGAFLGHPEWYKDPTHLTPVGQARHSEVIAAALQTTRP